MRKSAEFEGTPRFAFLVIANRGTKYEIMKRVQLATWVRDFRRIAPVYYVYGNGKLGMGEARIENLWASRDFNDPLFVPVRSTRLMSWNGRDLTFESVIGWDEILPNTTGALKQIIQNDKYDFLIRTNLSTYWNVDATVSLLESLPVKGTYAGPVRIYRTPYVEGDSIIFSSDIVHKVISNKNILNSELIDDLSIGELLFNLGTKPHDVQRPCITLKKLLNISFKGKNTSGLTPGVDSMSGLLKSQSVRCKNEITLFGFTLRLDPLIFMFLKLNSMRRNSSE